MNRFSRTAALVLAASASMLAACGGGGGDDAAQPQAPIITTKDQVLSVFNAVGFGPASVDYGYVAGTLVQNALPEFRSSATPVQKNCFGNGGVVSGSMNVTLNDADNSGVASAGDTVTMALDACFFNGAATTGTATFRLTAANNLNGYFDGSGTGSFAGDFNFGTLRVGAYAITGALTMVEAYEIRNGLRTSVSADIATLLTFTGVASNSFAVSNLRTDVTGDGNLNTTSRYDLTTTVNVPDVGNLAFTMSVLQPLVFPEDGNVAPSGTLLISNPAVDLRVTLGPTGPNVAVDNGRDGSVEYNFTFTNAELR